MNRSSTVPSLTGLKDSIGYGWEAPLAKEYISLERCLDQYPNIPLSTRISILLDVSSELAHLHGQNPPITVGKISACVNVTAVTPGLKATIIEEVRSSEDNSMPPGSTPSNDIYQFGLLILHVAGKDPTSGPDSRAQLEKESEALCAWSRRCLFNLAMSCLQPDPATRPSANELRSTLRQLSASCGKEHPVEALELEQQEDCQQVVGNSKLAQALDEENQQLRARCKELEAEIERLRKAYEGLLFSTREPKLSVS